VLNGFTKRLTRPNEFLRNTLTLMTGATLAQAIPVAIMPVLTRLYTPEAFGVLALYVSIVSIFSVVVTARYELAVMLPEKTEDAASLVFLSFLIAVLISLALLGVVYFFNGNIQRWLGNKEIGSWLYLTPLAIFVAGMYQALNYWNNRKKQFKQLAFNRVAQSSGSAGAQVLLSKISPGGGLILGSFVGQFSGLTVFLHMLWKEDKHIFSKIKIETIIKNARVYNKFPKYSTLGGLLDSVAMQMPVLMLNRFFNIHITGMFSLAFRALGSPLSLISAALSQVFFQKVVEIYNERPEQLSRYVLKAFFVLLALMLPVICIVWFFGEGLFAFVFGEKWRQAGHFAAILIFAVAIRFTVSPLSSILLLEHNLKLGTLWQGIYFFTITCTLYLFREAGIETFFLAFVIHEIVLYILYLMFILIGARR
jgi:O-antigen/teichoic acid export membrane protein